MKKNLLYAMMFVLSAFTLASCDKDTEGMTRITYYSTIELSGSSSVVLYLGESYEEEGYSAELDGEDVTDEVIVSSNVDNSTIGVYSISYTSYNSDGFSTSVSRTVYVVDPTSIANLYLGESQTSTRHYTGAPIYITDNEDGTYLVDDIMGGFQFYGLNPSFEPKYDFHAEANIRINDDNTVTMIGEVGDWYFKTAYGYAVTLTEGTFDPDTRTFYLTLDYAGTEMFVTLYSITK